MTILLHPRNEAYYREQSAKMSAISFGHFRCRCCKTPKPIAGRQKSKGGEGWVCADCSKEPA